MKRVYDFAFYRTFDVHEAEEITSDTFFKALKSFSTFVGSSESEFSSWIFSIAYHNIVDRSRTKKDHAELDEALETVSVKEDLGDALDRKDKLEKVLKYLDTLPAKQKDIVIMAVWDDLKYAEIAEITGESLSNIKKIVSRTLAKIAANVAVFLFIFFLF